MTTTRRPVAPSQKVQMNAVEGLLGGKVSLDYCNRAEGVFAANVQGSKPYPYAVAYYAGAWHCTCPATVTCWHILACKAFFDPDKDR